MTNNSSFDNNFNQLHSPLQIIKGSSSEEIENSCCRVKIEIRPLHCEDKPQWLPLFQQFVRFYDGKLNIDTYELTWSRLLDPHDRRHGLVAIHEGKIMGIAHYTFHPSTWAVNDYCYLLDLYVDCEARGMGIGRKLINAVLENAKTARCPGMYWITNDDNTSARTLYDNFVPVSNMVEYILRIPEYMPPPPLESPRESKSVNSMESSTSHVSLLPSCSSDIDSLTLANIDIHEKQEQSSTSHSLVVIRHLQSEDKSRWKELFHEFVIFDHGYFTDEFYELTWSRLLDPHDPRHGLVAIHEGKIMGIAHYTFHPSTWAVNDYCYLLDLYVDCEARGMGIGRKLMYEVREIAKRSGSVRLYWYTSADNTTARALYDSIVPVSNMVKYMIPIPENMST